MMRGIGRSITFKWMAFSILLATIPLAIAGGNIYKVYQKDIKESVIQIQKEKASMVVERTKGFLEKATSNLLLIASDENFRKTSPSQAKENLKNFLSQKDYFIELAFLNEKGLEMIKVLKFKTEGASDQKDQSVSQMFQVASKGQIFYGNFYYTSDGKQTMVIAVPVEKYKGRPVGVLKARMCLEPLTDLLHQTKIGETGSAYVMDKEGYLVAHPNEKNILLGPFVDQVIAGQEGSLEFENIRGQKYLVVYKPIPELKWGVVVQVSTEEAYAPLKEVASVAIKWILISLCVAFLISLFFTRRLVRPIKQLSSQMARVSVGDLDVHIETNKKDEVGMLTGSFNRMIQDLKQSQEAIKKAEEKYRKVFENSKDVIYITSADGTWIDVNQAGVEMLGYTSREELMKIPVKETYFDSEERKRFQSEIAKKGFVKDFDVKLKRKDGTRIEVLITATERRDEEGQIIGYEGNIKDISVRKEMEKELVQRRDEIQTLYDLSSLINQSLDLDRVIPLALEKVLTLTGFEMGTIYLISDDREWLELKYHQNYPSHLAEAVKRLKRGEGVVGSAVDKKKIITFSIDQYPSPRILPNLIEEKVKTLVGIPLLSKGEAVGAICLTSRSDRLLGQNDIHLFESLGNQIGMAIENARLFSSVAKAKSEWETTFDAVTDLITIYDRDYRILRANKAAFERSGLGPERMIGKKCYETLHDFSSPCPACYVTETLRTGKPASGELESEYLKGIFRYYTYPVYDESGKVVAVVDMAREITEEKRMWIEKEVINNVYKILASSLDVREVFRAVHSELKKVLDSERMTVVIFDEDGEGFRFFALDKDYEIKELMESVTYPLKGTPSEKVVETGLPIIVLDTEKEND
ncbi:MAG: PAS domain S-box protein, partial [Deltaproteobacteria bacterium]|nr:PAS domain S-box protein [Deltaproteobacteria bacterium]